MARNHFDAVYARLSDCIVFDTHEHLPAKESLRPKDRDILTEYLDHYMNRDLVSSGMVRETLEYVKNPKYPIAQRWKAAEPFWNLCRHTGYARSLDAAARIVHQEEGITGYTIESLNQKFLASLETPGHFRHVLKDISRIEVSIIDTEHAWKDFDRELFAPAFRIDKLINPSSLGDIRETEHTSGTRVTGFASWLEAVKLLLDLVFTKGTAALKCASAYTRDLYFAPAVTSDAEGEFNSLFSTLHIPDWEAVPVSFSRSFQDFMMHYIMEYVNERELTVQIHTGLQEGNGNHLSNSDPTRLTNLFLQYPQVRFVIFHMAFPYQDILGCLAKMFPNVFIDMSWAHMISPRAAVKAVTDWFDLVPWNKISAFVGDYSFIDGTAGHLHLAKTNISTALAQLVEEDQLDLEEAERIGKAMFFDSPRQLYPLAEVMDGC